jgi:hypothetical protein
MFPHFLHGIQGEKATGTHKNATNITSGKYCDLVVRSSTIKALDICDLNLPKFINAHCLFFSARTHSGCRNTPKPELSA